MHLLLASSSKFLQIFASIRKAAQLVHDAHGAMLMYLMADSSAQGGVKWLIVELAEADRCCVHLATDRQSQSTSCAPKNRQDAAPQL